jgi:hypothetical protein
MQCLEEQAAEEQHEHSDNTKKMKAGGIGCTANHSQDKPGKDHLD